MRPKIESDDALRRLFAGLTEQTFSAELGVADPALLDYLADLLVRFVKTDALFRVRDTTGRRLEDVTGMLIEAEQRTDRPQHELLRHIGDFTLFWIGVFPEALKRLQHPGTRDALIDYCEQGKRSYFRASTFEDERFRDEAPILRQLSEEFELCSFGLTRVRQQWEQMPVEILARDWGAERN